MIKHGIDFFRDEIRNGFYIPTAVKQSWAAALDVLSEIDKVCRKYNIKYFADWGSILGAVRHGGFVPWDDDLDICMLRDDYIRFRKVCDSELPSNYCIHDYERHQNHWLFLSRVVNNQHICFDENFLTETYNFPWLSSVDIFVKDYLYKDPEREKKRCEEIMHLLVEAESYIKGTDNEENRQKAIALYKKAEAKMAEVPPQESSQVSQLFPWGLKGAPGEDKELYSEVVYLPFEDTVIPVPAQYNKILSRRYGDYNVIRKGVAGHDYPSFDSQRKAFKEETGATLPVFSFDKEMLARPEALTRANGKREVLFLPIGVSEWRSLEDSFVKECESPDTDVYVVPLPLMHKDIYGRVFASDEEIIEAEHFEDYVNILENLEKNGNASEGSRLNLENVVLTGFTDYNLEDHYPDRIYIQSPYDAWNPLLTVSPYYYSENLRKFTKELIYIPLGPVSEYSDDDLPDMRIMDFYVTMPAPIYADTIYVQSENIKKHYVDVLTRFAEGTDRSYWEKKVIVRKALACPEISASKEHPCQKPKRILYGISPYEYYEHRTNFEESIRSRMQIFKDNSDKTEVEIFICSDVNSVDYKLVNNLAEEFKAAICDHSEDLKTEMGMRKIVSGFDAYYGSSSPIVQEFIAQKKPVMIANYDI